MRRRRGDTGENRGRETRQTNTSGETQPLKALYFVLTLAPITVCPDHSPHDSRLSDLSDLACFVLELFTIFISLIINN